MEIKAIFIHSEVHRTRFKTPIILSLCSSRSTREKTRMSRFWNVLGNWVPAYKVIMRQMDLWPAVSYRETWNLLLSSFHEFIFYSLMEHFNEARLLDRVYKIRLTCSLPREIIAKRLKVLKTHLNRILYHQLEATFEYKRCAMMKTQDFWEQTQSRSDLSGVIFFQAFVCGLVGV